jgi:cell division septum initiation protein DivIVA
MLTINHSIQQIVKAEYEDYIERMMAENEQMKEENEQMKEEIDQAKNTILNSAKAMKSAGLTVEIIEQATGLTKSEIENLK